MTPDIDRKAHEVADKSASFLARFGLSRLAGGIVLIVLGVLVLVIPDLFRVAMGIGLLVLGIIVLATR